VTPLDALNDHRQRAGLRSLVSDAQLVRRAGVRARQIAQHYGHSEGFPASEVLTVGTFPEGAALIWEWLSWPQHRRIIMDPHARTAGFASHARDGQTYWVGLIGG
jgi:uncharacterized protein YkwD